MGKVLAALVKDGILTLKEAAKRAGVSEETFRKMAALCACCPSWRHRAWIEEPGTAHIPCGAQFLPCSGGARSQGKNFLSGT